MQLVADAAAKYRHHPEWTNVCCCWISFVVFLTFYMQVYNKVSIRWTTHQPRGLTELDVKLAQLCDSYCEA